MSAHAEYGPSRLTYNAQCRAFTNTGGESEAAERGTIQHHAVETGDDDALSPEETEAVQKVRDYMSYLPTPTLALKEVTLQINLGVNTTFGTADYIGIQDEFAELIDYKFGKNSIPDVEDNAQGKAYAIGVFQRHPKIQAVRVTFLLPYRDEVLRHTWTRADYPALRDELDAIITESRQPNPPRTPCGACAYCKHKPNCGALAGYALQTANRVNPLPVLPESLDPANMTDEELGLACLPAIKVLDKWADAVKAEIKTRASNRENLEFPGAKVGKHHGKRVMKATAWEVFTSLRDQPSIGVDAYSTEVMEAFLKSCSITPGNVENLVKELTKALDVDCSKQEVKEATDFFLERLKAEGYLVQHPDYLEVRVK